MTTLVVTVIPGSNGTWDCIEAGQGKAINAFLNTDFQVSAVACAVMHADRNKLPYIAPGQTFLTIAKKKSVFLVIEAHSDNPSQSRKALATFSQALEYATTIGLIEKKPVVPHFWIAPDKTTI